MFWEESFLAGAVVTTRHSGCCTGQSDHVICSSLPYHSEKCLCFLVKSSKEEPPSPSPLQDSDACLALRSSPGSLSAHFLQVTTSSEESSLVAIHQEPSSLVVSSLYFVSSGHLKTLAVGVFVDYLALLTKMRVL